MNALLLLLQLLCLVCLTQAGQKPQIAQSLWPKRSHRFAQKRQTVVMNGEPWPMPQKMTCDSYLNVDGRSFQFLTASKCDIVVHAVLRYRKLMFGDVKRRGVSADLTAASLSGLQIQLTGPDCQQWPDSHMNESYHLQLRTGNGTGYLSAPSVWGLLRGLETFSQLFISAKSQIRGCEISDWPRFGHRGVLFDTSRHFLPVRSILENLDLMAHNKFNVFHWHIVDDQSFPYYSPLFPALSTKGAYSSRHVYYPADTSRVLEYARLLGIRVLTEFDSPGHTNSWGIGQPNLLNKCYDKHGKVTGQGLIDPTRGSSWDFLLAFFREALQTLPDDFIHLGGDEAIITVYFMQNNPKVVRFMKLHGFNSTNDLENYYFKNLFAMVDRARNNVGTVVWEEPFNNGLDIPKETIIQLWRGNDAKARAAALQAVTTKGYKTLLSSCWYLDHLELNWDYFYDCDPLAFNGTAAQKALVLGGEACMWGEKVDETNVVPRTWPRASAVAERLWSNPSGGHAKAQARFDQFRCLLIERGYPAEPQTGPGFCPTFWKPKI